jgi:hypothetical protein
MKLGAHCTTSTDSNGHVTTHNTDDPVGSDPSASNQPGSGTPGGGNDPSGGPGGGAVDPLTGEATGGNVSADGALTTASGTPVTLAAARSGQQHAIGWLVAAMLALTVLVPPFLIARHGRRP